MRILNILNKDHRLSCPHCKNGEIELKTKFAMTKKSDTVTQDTDTSILDTLDDAHTIYIDFYCKLCKGHHQLYITNYRGSTYVGWNKTVHSYEILYTRDDDTKEIVDTRDDDTKD